MAKSRRAPTRTRKYTNVKHCGNCRRNVGKARADFKPTRHIARTLAEEDMQRVTIEWRDALPTVANGVNMKKRRVTINTGQHSSDNEASFSGKVTHVGDYVRGKSI